MAIGRLTSKGQITVPKEVREHLHLASGDRLEFIIEQNGRVRLQPVTGSVRRLYGMFQQKGRPTPSVEQMEEAVIETFSLENERIRKGSG
ncbi:MAG: AbrB/MazE/SpoVT family DNA-binding domain-containing protein [Acidobacteriota bacterium]